MAWGAQEEKRTQQWTSVTDSAAGKSPEAQVTWKPEPAPTPQSWAPNTQWPWVKRTLAQSLHGHPVPAWPRSGCTCTPCAEIGGGVQGPRWNGRTQLLRGVSPRQGHPKKGTLPLLTPFWAGVPEQSRAASWPQGTLEQQGRGVPTWPPFSPGGPSLPGCPCQEREGLRQPGATQSRPPDAHPPSSSRREDGSRGSSHLLPPHNNKNGACWKMTGS